MISHSNTEQQQQRRQQEEANPNIRLHFVIDRAYSNKNVSHSDGNDKFIVRTVRRWLFVWFSFILQCVSMKSSVSIQSRDVIDLFGDCGPVPFETQ